MDDERHKLKLGKGVRFIKGIIRRLPQGRDIWEADFMPAGRAGHLDIAGWVGLVVNDRGKLLAEETVEEPPTVNDMAGLLADAMLRPFGWEPHRPWTLRIRSRTQWQPILPHLEQLGIRIVSAPRLARWDRALKAYTRSLQAPAAAPDPSPAEGLYRAVDKWVRTCGWIEIGDQQGVGFVARALDDGGLVFEDRNAATLSGAMSALERGIANCLAAEGLGTGRGGGRVLHRRLEGQHGGRVAGDAPERDEQAQAGRPMQLLERADLVCRRRGMSRRTARVYGRWIR